MFGNSTSRAEPSRLGDRFLGRSCAPQPKFIRYQLSSKTDGGCAVPRFCAG